MNKVLFFPLLRMPSGHHQVADTIANYLRNRFPSIECKKIDLLSSWNPFIESIITKTYLRWIYRFPKSYAWVYKQMAHTSKSHRTYKYYELLFLKKLRQIIEEERPDLIICTHGFPSYLLSRLKLKNQLSIPIINVYTDFFVNDVWGKKEIDYHFVPSQRVKQLLMEKGVKEQQIKITGIPTAEQFHNILRRYRKDSSLNILVSGGSIGLGNILKLFQTQTSIKNIQYYILCGKNNRLYQQIKALNKENIHPLPYISSREEMNELYNKVDAIITKPGGVTISEALKKGLPIFIHSALPGQEEINLQLLKELHLVFELNQKISIEEQLMNFFQNPLLYKGFYDSLEAYLQETKSGTPDSIAHFIHNLVQEKGGKELAR